MQRLQRQLTLIFALVLALSALGCATSSQTVSLSKTVASRGQDLATAALNGYDAIDDAATRDQQDQLTLKAFVPPAPLTSVRRQDFSAQLAPRRKAYRALKSAYGQFQVLAESNAGTEISTATGGLIDAVNGLSSLPDISGPAKGFLTTAAQQLATAQQQRSLRKYNEALAKLADAYRTLWNEDLSVFKNTLQGFTESYTTGIQGLQPSIFDSDLVQEAIGQPFTAEVAIRLYQVKLISTAQDEKAAIEAKLAGISRAFDGLVAAHAALAVDKPSAQDVLAAANQILDAIEKE